jgi:hypothetical protein
MLDNNRWANALRYSWVSGQAAAQARKEKKQKRIIMPSEKEPWTDREFCVELGKQWLKIYKAKTGKEHPIGPKTMWETEAGMLYVGSTYRDKAREAADVNYGMLAMMAKSELRQKYKLDDNPLETDRG